MRFFASSGFFLAGATEPGQRAIAGPHNMNLRTG